MAHHLPSGPLGAKRLYVYIAAPMSPPRIYRSAVIAIALFSFNSVASAATRDRVCLLDLSIRNAGSSSAMQFSITGTATAGCRSTRCSRFWMAAFGWWTTLA